MSLVGKVLADIQRTGFPLELRVGEVLRQRGYYVAHSLYYVDEDESKAREVDLRALKNFDIKEYRVRHCLLIECKKSENKPWVFFCSPTGSYDPEYYDVPTTPHNLDIIDFEDLAILEERHPFAQYPLRGRSYYEAFKNGDSGDAIMKALTTSVKATLFTMRSGFGGGNGNDICYYYPVIVLDGQLCQATLANGEIEVREVESVLASFLYRSPTYPDGQFAVPVLRESALPAFLASLDKTLQLLGTWASQRLHRAFPPSEEYDEDN